MQPCRPESRPDARTPRKKSLTIARRPASASCGRVPLYPYDRNGQVNFFYAARWRRRVSTDDAQLEERPCSAADDLVVHPPDDASPWSRAIVSVQRQGEESPRSPQQSELPPVTACTIWHEAPPPPTPDERAALALVTPRRKQKPQYFCPRPEAQRPAWNNRHHITNKQLHSRSWAQEEARRASARVQARVYAHAQALVQAALERQQGDEKANSGGFDEVFATFGKHEEIEAEEAKRKEAEDASRRASKERRDSIGRIKEIAARRRTSVLAGLLEGQVLKLYKATANIPSLQLFADFYKWCAERFRNLTRCWRLLDTDLNMRLTLLEFLNSLKEYNCPVNSRKIFKILDRDNSGSLSYFHFDPSGACELAALRQWAMGWAGSMCLAFKKMDKDHNGKLTLEELREAAWKHGFARGEAITCLFEMLDMDRNGYVTMEEVMFLDRWNCPLWLRCEPDEELARTFKNRLLAKHHGNPIIAWHALDLNHTMRVNWDEFSTAALNEGVLEERLINVWRAMDANMSGWLSLKEFDEVAFNLLTRFRKHCIETYGSCREGFALMDTNQSGRIQRHEFHRAVAPLHLSEDDEHMLFHGLVLDGKGGITPYKLRYLDKWGVENDEQEEIFWEVVSGCLLSKQPADQTEL